jgi:hypothetical protein
MKKASRVFLAVVSLAAVVIGATWYEFGVARKPSGDGARSASGPELREAGSDSTQTGSDPSTIQRGNTNESVFVGMAKEAARAADLRAFALAARQRPLEGGYLYASAAASYCFFSRGQVPRLREKFTLRAASSNQPSAAERLTTLERMEARCRNFSDDELRELRSLEFVNEGIDRGDPLLKTHREWKLRFADVARGAGDQKDLLGALMSLQDPSTLIPIRGASQGWEAGAKGPVGYLDGKRNGGLRASDYWIAWDLVECSVASGCGKLNDIEVALACVERGVCAEDRFQLLKRDLASDPGRFDEIMKVHARLLETTRTVDVDALMPPASLKGYRFN